MSDAYEPHVPNDRPRDVPPLTVLPAGYPPPPTYLPPAYVPPRPRASVLGVLSRVMLLLGFVVSVGVNVLLVFLILGLSVGRGSGFGLYERYHSGSKTAAEKIAIVRLEGVILEGLTNHAIKQIEQAAEDKNVKAVVLRINSPGGSITASDDLHRRVHDLRYGDTVKGRAPKKVIVSMGSLAASGGYYVAMPAEKLIAERTTITGSIGVFASFPNVTEMADKIGFRMEVVKAGDVKNSGSMFHPMTPQERQLWQDMVDHAYGQFLSVVEDGRPRLKGKLREVVIDRPIPVRDDNGDVKHDKTGAKETVTYVRRRADGGIYTADQAKKFGLIDAVGYLDDAIEEAARAAALGEQYKVVRYERPPSLFGGMFGGGEEPALKQLDPSYLAAGAMPRLWYLMPQSELSGILAATRQD